MKPDIENVLENIGLNHNETLVYIDLVKNGSSTALEISKRTKIHRSNVYDSIRSLVEKGFVFEVLREGSKHFYAMEPEKLMDYLIQREEQVETIIKELKSFSKESIQESVSVTKGIFGLREALQDLLREGEEIKAYGVSRQFMESVGEGFLEEFHRKRIMKKIVMKEIYNKALEKHTNQEEYFKSKHLSRKYDSKVTTIISGNTVLLVVFDFPISIIRIISNEISTTYANYFEILWTKAKI